MAQVSETFVIRSASEADVPLIFNFVKSLASYEKMEDSVTATHEILQQNLFGPQPYAHVVIGYHISEDGNEIPAGFALYFFNFSTFLGKPGLYLEDLFVKDEFRGKSYGKKLLQYLATIAKARDCGRFEWTVLDWNEPSIKFYKSLGAVPMDEWIIYRVAGDALDKLAAQF
jgi:GNAT superfamily N-acetyltransferase